MRVAIESCLVQLRVDLPAVYDPLGQVRVPHIQLPETYHIAVTTSNLCDSALPVKGVVSNQNTLEVRPKGSANVVQLILRTDSVVVNLRVGFSRLPNLHEPSPPLGKLLKEYLVGLLWLVIEHILSSGDRRDSDAKLPGFKELSRDIEQFQGKPTSVFWCSSVLI